MLHEIITVKVANVYGDIVVSKRQTWSIQTNDLRVYIGETLDTAFLVLPKFQRKEWDVVRFGGNWRHCKVWLESYDGRYTMYVSYRRQAV